MPRVLRIITPALILISGLIALLVGLAIGGGAAELPLQDPGVAVRYGQPVASLVVNVSVGVLLGALFLCIFALRRDRAEFARAMDIAAGAAAVYTVGAAAYGFLSFLSVTSATPSLDPRFGELLGQYLTTIPLGQAWLLTTLYGAVLTVLCFAVRNVTALAFVFALAAISLLPMAGQGHAAGAADHHQAVIALYLHLGFSGLWLGGLVVAAMISFRLELSTLVDTVTRYSSVALVCFIVVAISGYLSAEMRIGSLDRLWSPYGLLVLLKVLALVVLGIAGALHRRYLIRGLKTTQRRSWFWWLVVAELIFMGIASGLASALARTATPIPQELPTQPTPAQLLTGSPLPPELNVWRYFTEWKIDPVWLLVAVFGIAFYWIGVARLRRRGDRWPIYRPILWTLGMLLLVWITSGGVNVYQKYLFSSHMLGHMMLSMMVPVLLVPGAPVTLALRAVAKRRDGTRGPREWILWAVHSPFGRFIANPIVDAVLFATSLLAFYYTPLFRWAMTDHLGHQWMVAHFLIVGYLFVQALIGIDPVPYRLPYPFRLLLLLATMAFHAFFGLAIMSGSGVIMADWFGAMGRPWGPSALEDQQTGGGIAWSIGEIPTVALAIIVSIQWARSDRKATVRSDRNADRTGNAELKAYNEMLERLASRDGSRSVRDTAPVASAQPGRTKPDASDQVTSSE